MQNSLFNTTNSQTQDNHALLDDLETHFGSLVSVRNLAVAQKDELFEFMLDDSAFKARYLELFFTQRKLNGREFLEFRAKEFLQFLTLRVLGTSFTAFSNKIGLASDDKFIIKDEKVVLNFPFKDGVIKGAQSKDEDKTNEVFFNDILARDEIDILFSPKALQNFELVTSNLLFDNATIKSALQNTPNLLIKGNNLLALHSLKKRKDIYGQVKLIYIDPPYNTGNDSFNYNDKFNHSAWLTFMKNRLEIAKEFLRDDGVIFVQCDDNEQAYLKVLMDEIFGRDNFVSIITCKVKSAGGLTTDTEMFFDCAEYVLVYSKNITNLTYTPIKVKTEIVNSNSKTAKQYNNIINKIDYSKMEFVVKKDDIAYYKITKGNFNIETLPIKNMSEKDFFDKRDEIFRLTALSGGIGKKLKRHIEDFTNNEDLFVYEYMPTKGKDKGKLSRYLLYKSQTITMLNKFLEIDEKNKTITKLEPVSNIFIDDFWQGISQEGQIKFKNAKKPEALLKRIIEISTQENDLVMDFFAGSGTTLAIAHKMNRRFVGIEQMDYIKTITKERLKKVVEGEQGGISKAVNFVGGGEFVYVELMPLNAVFKERIQASNDESELERIYKDLQEKAFVDYRVDIKEMLKDKDFEALNLDEKKRILLSVLDSNMDYVPLSEIEDSEYGISSELVELNKAFFKGGEDE